MEIIAHRGFWDFYEERNTLTAFERAADSKFGIETDFRDYKGELVISHDIAGEQSISVDKVFKKYENRNETLAVNIKADGLQKLIKKAIEKYSIKNYFCFDMSVPDTLGYIDEMLLFFVRESEYECINSLYEEASGVWMDGFIDDSWITEDRIEKHLSAGKRVCVVSPELHGRQYKEMWEKLRGFYCCKNNQIILCTDYPMEARGFFYE